MRDLPARSTIHDSSNRQAQIELLTPVPAGPRAKYRPRDFALEWNGHRVRGSAPAASRAGVTKILVFSFKPRLGLPSAIIYRG
jgi:hypothetical protein